MGLKNKYTVKNILYLLPLLKVLPEVGNCLRISLLILKEFKPVYKLLFTLKSSENLSLMISRGIFQAKNLEKIPDFHIKLKQLKTIKNQATRNKSTAITKFVVACNN